MLNLSSQFLFQFVPLLLIRLSNKSELHLPGYAGNAPFLFGLDSLVLVPILFCSDGKTGWTF